MSANLGSTTYTSVTWAAGDIITEAKMDNMVANDQAYDSHEAQGITLANNKSLGARDVGDSNYLNLVKLTAADKIEIGDSGIAGVDVINAVEIRNNGTEDGVRIDQNGDGVALFIDSECADGSSLITMASAGTSPLQSAFTRVDAVTGNIALQLGGSWIWVDATGDLRIATSKPGSDTAGVVVGTQS